MNNGLNHDVLAVHFEMRMGKTPRHGEGCVRTTLTIEDGIASQLQDAARRSGRSFDAVVNEALRAGLRRARVAASAKRYRVGPVAMGDVAGRQDLDQALPLADQLEDQELVRKVQLRK